MAAKKVKSKAKVKAARKIKAKIKSAGNRVGTLDLGKYTKNIKLGKYSWDDVLKNTSKNMDAVADANHAIIEGYTDIARQQFDMLKELLHELRKVRGDRDAVVRELKRVIERVKKDVKELQKMARKTNSTAQRIVKRRAEANLIAWKNMVTEAKKSFSRKLPEMKKPTARKMAAPKKKAAPKRKAAPRKKPTARKRPKARTG